MLKYESPVELPVADILSIFSMMKFDLDSFLNFIENRQKFEITSMVNMDQPVLRENNIIPNYVVGSEELYVLYGFANKEELIARCIFLYFKIA